MDYSNNTIHIAYTANRAYISLAAISIHSLLESNPYSKFHIHILGYELSEKDISNIESLIPQSRVKLSVYSMHKLQDYLTIDVPSSFPIIAYARLFLASVLPTNINRVLYLDGDTIIMDDISQFYNTDLRDNLVGAILDPVISSEYKYRTSISRDEAYINAGVLLIPLDKWRRECIETKFIKHLRLNNGKVYLFDQGLVNAVCAGRKMLFPPKYNLMSNYMTFGYKYLKIHNKPFYTEDIIKDAISSPAILHFTGRTYGRPWEEGCTHPYKELFAYHKKQTAYKDVPLAPSSVRGLEKFEVWIFKNMPFSFFKAFKSISFAISHLKNQL